MQDATGQVSYTGYDNATGAVTLSITDADPSEMPDEISPPDDLTRPTSLPTADPQTTITVVDNQGRPTSMTDANGKTTTYAYADSASDEKVTVTPPTGPVQVTDSNLDKGWTDSYTKTADDGTIESLTRQISNIAGTSLTTDTFTNLSGITYSDTAALGAQNTNYSQTIQTDSGPPDGVDTSVSTDDLGNVTQTTTNAFGQAVAVQEWSAAAFAAGAAGVTLETDEYDADGNEIQTTDYPGHGEAPQVTDMEFNWLDEQVASESGVGTSTNQISFNVLNNLGQPTTEEELSGKNLTFADDPDGEPQVPSGAQLVAETVVQTDADGNPDSADQMNVNPTTGSVVGTSGETTENYYDQDGNVVASEDPNGVWTKTVYNDEGEVSAVYSTDGSGDDPFSVDGDVVSSQQEFQYDDDGNTILTTTRTRLATASPSATGALDSSDSTVDYLADYYDADDQQIEEADFGDNGGTDMTAPPALADVPSPGTDDDVLVTQTDYDADGNVADTIDSTGTETKYSYDADGEVTQEIDNYIASIDGGNPTGEANLTTNYTYDGDGDVLTVEQVEPSDQVNETTEYVYGTGANAGQVVQTENPDPVTGDPSTAADEEQTDTFDNLGNVISETDPDGTAQTFNYNALDQMTLDDITALGSGESGLVRATGYTYAPDGQAFQTTDYSNASASTIADQTQDVYDGYGNQIGEYDSQQGPVNTATTPEVTVTPNADGQTSSSTNPLGASTSNTFQGGTVSQTNQSGHAIPAQYNYDPVTGQLSSLNLYPSGTVGSGTPETTTWKYDPTTGQIENETFADGTQDNYTYNDEQQLATETLPGETITDGYNTAGDQTSSTAVDSITGTTVTDTSTYGTDGMLASVSQTTSGATTSSATNTFTYDDDGNVTSETQAGGVTTEYTYFGDSSNNPGAVQSVKEVQDDTTINETDYAYNSAQQLTSMTVNGQTFTYGYQSGTNVISSVTTGGVTTTYSYNADTGNLTSINAGNGAYSASYTYNANNQRQTQTVSQTNSAGSIATQNYGYTYDNANELATVTSGGSTIYNYSYDGAGNQTGTSMGTANSMNEYSNFTYNSRGDLTDDGTYAYTWNANNQLTAVTAHDDSVRVTFAYDGQSRCIEKDVYNWDASANDDAGGWAISYTRKFVYDGTQLVEELDGDNNPVTGYTWGANGLLAVTDYTGSTPTVYAAVLDANGNVVGLVNATTGQVAATYTYDPYGKLLTESGPAAGINDILSNEGIYVRELDDVIDDNRIDSTVQDRWLNPDPSGIAGGLNEFIYCKDNPLTLVDPTGLAPVDPEVLMDVASRPNYQVILGPKLEKTAQIFASQGQAAVRKALEEALQEEYDNSVFSGSSFRDEVDKELAHRQGKPHFSETPHPVLQADGSVVNPPLPPAIAPTELTGKELSLDLLQGGANLAQGTQNFIIGTINLSLKTNPAAAPAYWIARSFGFNGDIPSPDWTENRAAFEYGEHKTNVAVVEFGLGAASAKLPGNLAAWLGEAKTVGTTAALAGDTGSFVDSTSFDLTLERPVTIASRKITINIGAAGESPTGPGTFQINNDLSVLKKIDPTAGFRIQGDMQNLPFANNSVNLVQGNWTPFDNEFGPAIANEAFRVLQPGGKMVWSSRSGGATLGKIMEKVGFTNVRQIGVYKGVPVFEGTKPG